LFLSSWLGIGLASKPIAFLKRGQRLFSLKIVLRLLCFNYEKRGQRRAQSGVDFLAY